MASFCQCPNQLRLAAGRAEQNEAIFEPFHLKEGVSPAKLHGYGAAGKSEILKNRKVLESWDDSPLSSLMKVKGRDGSSYGLSGRTKNKI